VLKGPAVVVLSPYYLPGINGGGPVVSVKHLIEALPQVRFRVLTRIWDLGATEYPGLLPGVEYIVGKAAVVYLGSVRQLVPYFWRLRYQAPPNVVYSNSFFDPFCTVGVLGTIVFLRGTTVLIAPRGEFSPGCLQIKPLRKRVFVLAFRALLRLTGHRLHFQATTNLEAEEIAGVLAVPESRIRVMGNLPSLQKASESEVRSSGTKTESLRVVMFARVSSEKNLKFAIRALQHVRRPVDFDVIGPVSPSSAAYFEECKVLAKSLPPHVRFQYLGRIEHEQIVRTLSRYDLALYPTLGDNFAHVIADALRSGVKLLISPFTPWCDIEERGWGFVRPLDSPRDWAAVIDAEASKHHLVRVDERVRILDGLNLHPLFARDVPVDIFDFPRPV
jgi:glycosyltransferase involved in cell wall biosynthesis